MELPPDFSPAAEYTSSTAILPRPTLLRNLGFWLLAMLLGLGLMLLYMALAASRWDNKGFSFLLLVAGSATICSVAVLPLLLPLLPWALTASSVGRRWLRVFTLQSLSLGILTGLVYQLAGGGSHGGFGAGAPLVGTVYFVAGLLAARVVYRSWLSRG